MGVMNLLKANYVHKVGKTVGAEWKHKPVLRTLPERVPKHTQAQTDALVAFGHLNRLAGYIAYVCPYIDFLYDSHQSLHNKIAHFCKPTLWGHKFNPISFYSILGINAGYNIRNATYENATASIVITFGSIGGTVYPDGAPIFTVVFYEDGTPIASKLTIVHDRTLTLPMPTPPTGPMWVWSITFKEIGFHLYPKWTDCSNGPFTMTTPATGAFALVKDPASAGKNTLGLK
jgi:hypothetical protein